MMRIRSRLLLLVLAVLVPAFFGAAIGIAYVYQEEQGFHRQSMRETARALALMLDKEIARRESVLHTLATSPALDRGDFASFYQQVQRIASERDVAIILHQLSGEQLVNTRLPFGTRLPNMLPAAQELRAKYPADATVVTDLYNAPIGRTISFAVQVPVMRNGKALYYLAMGSYASQLQAVFTAQRLPEDWHAGIVDRNGILVARSKDAEKFVGKPVRADFAQALSASEGFHEGVTLAGVPATAFFSRAPASEWTFFVSVPTSVLQRPAIEATALMACISLLLIGLAALVALMAARSTARSIEALRRTALRLGRGKPVAPPLSGTIEIDAVNAAMVRASEEIHRARADLEQRVADAVARAERSQRALLQAQKLEALGRLTGGIAHDFNNVLQTVATGLELALMRSNDSYAVSALESCKRAVHRAVELTRQLAAFGRVQDARLETIEPYRQLNEMKALLCSGLRSDIEFQLDIVPDLWPVTLDPLQFELALLNLTINARDAMSGGGVLRIQARNETLQTAVSELAPGDYVRLTVADSGEGMTQDVLAKAFDPFFTTKSVGKGSGMGLPQAYGFARQTGGTLILRSMPKQGTQAVLYLPKARVQAIPIEPMKALPARKASGETVLFVEDDALVRDVVRPALESAGFRLLVAEDGAQALQLLESGERVDLLFTDIVMPGALSGIDLAQTVRARYPDVRVVLATGYTDRRVALTGVRTLAKPYDVAQVVDALHDALPTAS